MLKITSRDNPKLKFARKVRDGREKGAVFVEGFRLAEEAVKSDLQILECFLTEDFQQNERSRELIAEINQKTQNTFQIPAQIFNSLSDTQNSQGIILICEKPETGKEIVEKAFNGSFEKFPLIVLLHQINNPSNLGAILRTAEAVGVSSVILTKNSADVFSPKALRGAMGASFRLKFWTNAGFREILDWSTDKNLTSICADINSEKSLWEVDWKKPRLLIFGSEAYGLSAEERSLVEESLIIPMETEVESLNLAVSCGIVLYEARRNWL
ncbi:MAG TPA: RNA methyltransferase [Pyrinomonadaceae bacterium]|nr:RNA methyltransferase [Pyrinomonadaceae bacterium]